MDCPDDAELMNYALGRPVSPEVRARVSRCKKCRQRLARLEDAALAEGLEMKGQVSYSFERGRETGADSRRIS